MNYYLPLKTEYPKNRHLSEVKASCVFLKSQVLLKYVVREPAVSVPLGRWLEMQDLRLTPHLPPRNLHLSKVPPAAGDSHAHSGVRSAALGRSSLSDKITVLMRGNSKASYVLTLTFL